MNVVEHLKLYNLFFVKNLLLIFILLIQNQIYAQTNNLNDIDFMVQKIKTVYSGFNDKVKIDDFNHLIEIVKSSKSLDTFATLSKLTLYFNDHHLKLFQKNKFDTNNVETYKSNLISVETKNKSRRKFLYEGYWINDLNTIVIFLCQNVGGGYEGYVIESKKKIPKGLCLIKMEKKIEGKYITDHTSASGNRVFLKSFFKNKNLLYCNSYSKWKKVVDYKTDYLTGRNEIEREPSLDLSDTSFAILKMPSFNGDLVRTYDSIIRNNKVSISKASTLILDLRNNMGGVINCFLPLFSLICSKPIISPAIFTLSSDDVIEDFKKRREKYLLQKDTSRLFVYDEYIKKLQTSPHDFVYNKSDTVWYCKPRTPVYNNIKNVAIITNNACLSAAELMLLYFKQSDKVKIFGENTGGAVDYLDAFSYKLPITNYTFWVASTKRAISKLHIEYDKTGIKPDIAIDNNVSDWVSFVKNYYGEN